MSKGASLNQVEKLMAAGKPCHPKLAAKILETYERAEKRLERLKKAKEWAIKSSIKVVEQ